MGSVAYISTKAEGVVNNWLLAHLHMCFNVLLCQQYVCERSCCSMVALVVYVASYSYSVLVVTITFVVAANITTFKPFNTAMGRR